MPDPPDAVARLAAAVATLQKLADDPAVRLEGTLYAREAPTDYHLTAKVVGTDGETSKERVDWLRRCLAEIAPPLLAAGFEVRLEVGAHGRAALFSLSASDGDPVLAAQPAEWPISEDDGEPPAEATFSPLWEWAEAQEEGLPAEDVLRELGTLETAGAILELRVEIYFNKSPINAELEQVDGGEPALHVVSFLFVEALADALEARSISQLEEDFFPFGTRTVIPVFGLVGAMKGDRLTVCGAEATVAALSPSPVEVARGAEAAGKARQTLEFRKFQGFWSSPTRWLTPDVFVFAVDDAGPGADPVRRQWGGLKGLLSILFLADVVEKLEPERKDVSAVEVGAKDRYVVEYRGLGQSRCTVSRSDFLARMPCADGIFALWADASERFKADKLEIAQQFLSLMAQDLDSLCQRAPEIRDATKKTYDRDLRADVKTYFDAREKVQDRIRQAVAETASAVISLTRDVSSDLYKIAGVVAAGLVGAILKPDLTLWAVLGAAMVTASYMLLVLLYHLPTVRRSYRLRMAQHDEYIQSFKDVLLPEEIKRLLADPHLKDSKFLFDRKSGWATVLYFAILLLAVDTVAVSSLLLAAKAIRKLASP